MIRRIATLGIARNTGKGGTPCRITPPCAVPGWQRRSHPAKCLDRAAQAAYNMACAVGSVGTTVGITVRVVIAGSGPATVRTNGRAGNKSTGKRYLLVQIYRDRHRGNTLCAIVSVLPLG